MIAGHGVTAQEDGRHDGRDDESVAQFVPFPAEAVEFEGEHPQIRDHQQSHDHGNGRNRLARKLQSAGLEQQPQRTESIAAAGLGSPQNSVRCVSSILNFASRNAAQAVKTKTASPGYPSAARCRASIDRANT